MYHKKLNYVAATECPLIWAIIPDWFGFIPEWLNQLSITSDANCFMTISIKQRQKGVAGGFVLAVAGLRGWLMANWHICKSSLRWEMTRDSNRLVLLHESADFVDFNGFRYSNFQDRTFLTIFSLFCGNNGLVWSWLFYESNQIILKVCSSIFFSSVFFCDTCKRCQVWKK